MFLSFNEAKEPRACRRPVPRSAFIQRRVTRKKQPLDLETLCCNTTANLPRFTPTQSLSCFCQQSVGKRDFCGVFADIQTLCKHNLISVYTYCLLKLMYAQSSCANCNKTYLSLSLFGLQQLVNNPGGGEKGVLLCSDNLFSLTDFNVHV